MELLGSGLSLAFVARGWDFFFLIVACFFFVFCFLLLLPTNLATLSAKEDDRGASFLLI